MGSVCDVNLTLPVLPSTEINKQICGTIRKGCRVCDVKLCDVKLCDVKLCDVKRV